MKLEDFEFIPLYDNSLFGQTVLQFDENHHLNILSNNNKFDIELYKSGHITNPFDSACTGTINNVSEQQINNYILLLTLLTGSHPTQL